MDVTIPGRLSAGLAEIRIDGIGHIPDRKHLEFVNARGIETIVRDNIGIDGDTGESALGKGLCEVDRYGVVGFGRVAIEINPDWCRNRRVINQLESRPQRAFFRRRRRVRKLGAGSDGTPRRIARDDITRRRVIRCRYSDHRMGRRSGCNQHAKTVPGECHGANG